METNITLTNDQRITLRLYLLMTKNYRGEEREAWEKLATEQNEDGTPKFQHAKSNAEFWADMDKEINEIIEALD